jgi:hypothetical protein
VKTYSDVLVSPKISKEIQYTNIGLNIYSQWYKLTNDFSLPNRIATIFLQPPSKIGCQSFKLINIRISLSLPACYGAAYAYRIK